MGSSRSGPARDAKKELTPKGSLPFSRRASIYAASSGLTEAAKTGGRASVEVIRGITG
jgi:hypothetical protein